MLFPIKLKFPWRQNEIIGALIQDDVNRKMVAINKIRIGTVFKTTYKNRFPLVNQYLKELDKKFGRVYDIGSGDGMASNTLISTLKYQKYFCLDKNHYLAVSRTKLGLFLIDEHLNAHMFENKYFLIYLDPLNVHSSIFEKITSAIFRFIPINHDKISFISNQNLTNFDNKKLELKRFDLFSDKLKLKADLIIIFNLLNKFNESKYLEVVKASVAHHLDKNGILVIGENDKKEKATIYQLRDKLLVRKKINGGSVVSF